MALFKILRGSIKNLPKTKTEGYMYITEDVGDIYVDMSNSKRVRLNAEAAEKIRKITYNSDGSYKSEVSLDYDFIKDKFDALDDNIGELKDKRPIYILNVELTGEYSEEGFEYCTANTADVIKAAQLYADNYVVYCVIQDEGIRTPMVAVQDGQLVFMIGVGVDAQIITLSFEGIGMRLTYSGINYEDYEAFLEEYNNQIGALQEADAEFRSELGNKAPHRSGVYFVKGTGTKEGTWLGTSSDITEYYDGLTIAYEIGIAGASTTTLNINGLGAKTCYRYGTSKITTQYSVGTIVLLVYSATKGAWYATDYDTDTKVSQGRSTTSSYRSLLMHNVASEYGVDPGNAKDTVYYHETIAARPDTGDIRATSFTGTLKGNADTATALTSKSIGSTTKPVYFDANGKPVEVTYTLGKSVPSDAKFTDTTYSNFVKSGSGAKAGLVPAPSTTAGTTKYLREDGTWAVPPDNNTTYGVVSTTADGLAPKRDGSTTKFLRGDGTWAVPSDKNTTYTFATGDNNGQIKVTPSSGSATNVSVKGLGSAAYATKGAANGVAELDANGKVPSSQLPSYVDDIIEISSSEAITDGEAGKIYVDTDNNKTYRWSGSALVEISASLALGETSSTAYRGDRGKIAYDHSQSPHAPADAEKNQNAYGRIMKNNATNVSYDATNAFDTIVFGDDGCIKVDVHTGTSGTNVSYSIPSATTSTRGAVQIGSNINVSNGVISVPIASGSAAGVTIVYPAASCTTFSSDSGTITPLAAQKAAKMFAITRPTSVVNTIPRFTNTTGDVQSTGIKIESVTNSKDSSKTAHVLSIPAEGGKKMIYGYCTDQVDGTSFIGGVFDADETSFPYSAGLAIGGTSGNLLWKGSKVITESSLAEYNYATTSALSSYLHKTSTTAQTVASAVTFNSTTASSSKTTGAVIVKGGVGVSGSIYGNKVYGAVWNDYAEYREGTDEFEAGRVVCENGDDTLSLATERLQPGANIVSDTFGFAIGETEKAKTPLAVSGRVLAYTYEDRESYKPGDAVCAAPNGTVSKMTREEIREYPERIIGTVSAIPTYETWGENNVLVNGRIWIKIK